MAAENPVWVTVLVGVISAVGGLVAALVGPLRDLITRRDKLKTYKRNVYRNFLDHAYWLRLLDKDADPDAWQERAEKYLADYRRIMFLSDNPELTERVKRFKQPGSLPEAEEDALEQPMNVDIGRTDPKATIGPGDR